MEHYLVDFENVSSAGLEGMAGLGRDSFVYIIYTTSSTKIRLDVLENVDCGGFRTIKVRAGKQSLDMHLISYLGYLIGSSSDPRKDKFRIISCDRDYDGTAEFWRERMGFDVRVQKTISGKASAPVMETENEASPSPEASSSRKRKRKRHGKKDVSPVVKEESILPEGVQTEYSEGFEDDYEEESLPLVEEVIPVAEDDAEEEVKKEEPQLPGEPAQPKKRRRRSRKHDNSQPVFDFQEAKETESPAEEGEAKVEEVPQPKEEVLPKTEEQPKAERKPLNEEERAYFEKTLAEKAGRKNLKTAIHRSLISKFGPERGAEIYKMVKSEIK